MRIETRIVMIGLFCLVALPALAAESLTPDQIKKTFATGRPFVATSPGGVSFSLTFNSDGTATELVKGGTKVETGKWRLSETGYCTQWGKNPERCYIVRGNDDRYEVIGPGSVVVARWIP